MAAARTFSVLSANHGYKFLYLPLRRRLPIGQLRSRLRQLNINTHRILSIHYPDCHLIALLIHNDYEDELHSSNLRNPDYDDWDEASRTTAAGGLFLRRILHVLDYPKGPVKQSVASFFANKGYIDRGDFPELFPVKKT
ncbi:hypothetical protein RMATCC62417_02671 [Rhizopus microsporus]|nr:hypothetical protein RMATCC62417_02671 [Rhizopus microsporus]